MICDSKNVVNKNQPSPSTSAIQNLQVFEYVSYQMLYCVFWTLVTKVPTASIEG